MNPRELRRRCEARLRGLELPMPFDIQEFCATVAARRQRPIFLRAVSSEAGPCGACVSLPTGDFILYEQQTPPLHQQHIILHEVCHLLCGHRALQAPPDIPDVLFPSLSPDLVQTLLRRAGYAAADEQEAELLASLILERTAPSRLSDSVTADPATAGFLSGLEVCLVGRRAGATRSRA